MMSCCFQSLRVSFLLVSTSICILSLTIEEADSNKTRTKHALVFQGVNVFLHLDIEPVDFSSESSGSRAYSSGVVLGSESHFPAQVR